MSFKSHQILIKVFRKLFPGMALPQQEAFSAFLAQQPFHCFIDKDAPLRSNMTQVGDEPDQFLLYLPPSDRLSSKIVQVIGQLIQDNFLPVVLYWPWASHVPERYVPLRISLIPRRQGGSCTIHYHTEIIGCCDFPPTPTPSFIRELKTYCPTFHMETLDSVETYTPAENDTVHWTALTLFLRLCQDVDVYRTKFIHSQTENPLVLTGLAHAEQCVDDVFKFVRCLDPVLFYIEQALPIFNMPPRVRYMMERCIPRTIPPRCALQVLRAGFILKLMADGIDNVQGARTINHYGYETLIYLPFIAAVHLLMKFLRKNISNATTSQIMFYAVLLLSMGGRLFFHLYRNMPDFTPIQYTAVIPRFVLLWFEGMTQAILPICTRLVTLIPLLIILEKLLPRFDVGLQDVELQAGFYAMALFLVDFIVACKAPSFYQFTRWKPTQTTEEAAIMTIQQACEEKKPCRLTVKTPLVSRLAGHSFFDEQNTQVEIMRSGELTQCHLKITPANTSTQCYNIQTSCQSHSFYRSLPNETAPPALLRPHGTKTDNEILTVAHPIHPEVHAPTTITYCPQSYEKS